MLPCGLHTCSCALCFEEKPARTMSFCLFPGSMGSQTEGGVPKQMMPSLLSLLFNDAFSDHACVFLCVSMHLEAELLTQEEIPTQCRMATQDWMATQEWMATQDETAVRRLNFKRPSQLSTPKSSRWFHNPYAVFRTLC